MTSYFRINGSPGILQSTVQSVFLFLYFGIPMGYFIGIPCARKYGHKLVSGINMIVFVGSLYLASSVTNFYVFVAFFGYVPGLCVGIEYLVSVENG